MMNFSVGAGRFAALSGERASCSKADFDQVMSNAQLDKMKGSPDLVQSIMETTVLDSAVRRGWKVIGEEMSKIYSRGEMYDPAFQLALKDLVYLALPDDVKKSYRAKYAPKKKGEVESRAVVALKKLKHAAQKRVSDTVAAIVKAAYPPMAATKLPSEKADDEKDAEAELKSLAGEAGEREEERSRSTETGCSAYTDDSAMDGDGDDDEEEDGGNAGAGVGASEDEDDATGGLAKLNLSKPPRSTASEARAKKAAIKRVAPAAATTELIHEKTAIVRAAAEKITEAHLLISTPPARDAAGTLLYAVPEPIYIATGQLMTQLAATFKPDGTLTAAAAAAPQSTLPL